MGHACGKDTPFPAQPERPSDFAAASSAQQVLPRPGVAKRLEPGQFGGFGRARFIGHSEGILDSLYELGERAGEGTQGTVFKAERKADGTLRAIKRVMKAHVRGPQFESFKKEVEIMKILDHPNIVKLYDTFEDKMSYFLVMELCSGGELLEKIIKQGHLSEAEAAVVVQQVLRAVFYMHENSIVHRDLKPENFLLADDGPINEDNLLKLIDFGIACQCSPGQMLSELCGTPFYVAPQVVTKRYDKRCDLWSVGVIMYTLLSGSVPFNGTDQEILHKARVGIVAYPEKAWSGVSEEARSLVKKLLTRNAETRITAEAALNDIWIKHMAPKAKKAKMPEDLVNRLKSFRNQNIVKKAALQIVAGEASGRELRSLREVFTSLDKNGDGTLTIKEITEGFERSGIALPADFESILRGVDANGSGIVDYTEFLAATMDHRWHLTEHTLRIAFNKFDKNGDGRIRAQEIVTALSGDDRRVQRALEKAANEVIKDFGSSDQLDFKQFLKMMTDDTMMDEVAGITLQRAGSQRRISYSANTDDVVAEGLLGEDNDQ